MIKIYPWHEKSWDILLKSLDKLPNAFLFLGQKGTGVLDFVLYLSKTLLCETKKIKNNFIPCDKCSSCLLFNSNTHPDFYNISKELDPKNSNIKIELINDLMEKLSLSSLRGGLKVVLINLAENLNKSSANAMLKLLEEPPKDVIFLLISYNIAKVLPTIVSRCRKFNLLKPTYQDSLLYLEKNNIKNAEEKLRFNSCNPIFNINNDEILLKDKLFEFLVQPKIGYFLEISEILDKNKITLELSIDWLLKWVIDIVSLYYTDNIIYNLKFKNDIKNITQSINILRIFEIYDKLKDTYKLIGYNLNYRLQFENLLIDYLTLWKNL